ncbi:Ankyrin repeat domain-containing protein [Plasmodiophora brassicae]|uniref:Uncharacterized protein n=1 Tax=Plasmodiophora brassicae TaxID=37360 RepID=A0A0G4IX80_PLABS|nr:hypothetical protein PBRA_007374 [Plasmodiophora brassicae]SPQ98024.1 unnamed protein product [Plasmodiophora brassicae]
MLIASRRSRVSARLSPSTLVLIVGLSCIAVGDGVDVDVRLVMSGVDGMCFAVSTEAARWHSVLLRTEIDNRRGVIDNWEGILVSGVHSTELHVIVEFINSLHPETLCTRSLTLSSNAQEAAPQLVDRAADWILKHPEYVLDTGRLFELVKAANIMQMPLLAVALAAKTYMYDASDLSERIRRMEPVPAFQFHFGLVTLLVNAVDDDQKAIDRIIRNLLVFGGDANQLTWLQWDHQFGSVLHWAAASEGKELIVDLLCRHVHGINLNHVNAQGYTPLHLAVLHNRAEIVKLLVATSGSNVNARDAHGHTPLSLAAMQGSASCVDELLKAPDINVNERVPGGDDGLYVCDWTPLQWAATRGGTPGAYGVIVSLTQELRVDIDAKDAYGRTAWHLAQCSGSSDVMNPLSNALVIRQNAVGEHDVIPRRR